MPSDPRQDAIEALDDAIRAALAAQAETGEVE